MNDFNPGPDWREAEENEAFPAGTHVVREHIIGQRDYERVWVREEPVTPPIELYTVIRVTWIGGSQYGRVLTLVDEDRWLGGNSYSSAGLAKSITSFEVLAQPFTPGLGDELREVVRRETAKAVLDRVERDGWEASPEVWREFGVSL